MDDLRKTNVVIQFHELPAERKLTWLIRLKGLSIL